jgi:ABC-type amino acid transport substrate-binding protein
MMRKHFVSILFIANLLMMSLIAACQTTEQATLVEPTAETLTPTIPLIPPIQPGDGSDLIDRLLEQGVIRVGLRVWPEPEFSPPAFRGFTENTLGAPLNGFEVEIAKLLAEGLGLELELVEAYPPVILGGDWRGQWDVALASIVPFDQPIGDARMVFSQPYAYMPMGILIPAATDNIQTVEQLTNRRVGVLEYSAYQRLLLFDEQTLTVQGQPLLTTLPSNTRPIALSNLQKTIRQMGQVSEPVEVEAIFGPVPVFQEAIDSGLAVKLAPEAASLGLQPLAIAVVPQDDLKVERLVVEIDKVLDRARRQGVLSEIYLRWYGQDLSGVAEIGD